MPTDDFSTGADRLPANDQSPSSISLPTDDYRTLLQSFAQATWETNPQGLVVSDSPSWRAYTGQTLEEWLGEGWGTAIHPDDRPYALHQWQQAVRQQRSVNAEFRLRSPDGGWRWTNVRATAIRGADGTIQKWVGLNIDISERKRAEEQLALVQSKQWEADLKGSQNLLRATLDSSLDMIQVFEAVRNEQDEIIDFVWILNNHASEKIYGHVLGKSLLHCQPGVVEAGIFAAFNQVIKTGLPQQYETHYVHEPFNGWFYQSVVKMGDGVATTTADITGRKKAETLQAYLLTLSDGLRELADAGQIQQTALQILGQHLQVDRVFYAEVDADEAHFVMTTNYVQTNVRPMIGRFPLSVFGLTPNAQRTGQRIVMANINQAGELEEHLQAYRAEGIIAFIAIPLLKGGRWVASLVVHDSRPRQWTNLEVSLIEQTADRIWAALERAKVQEALHKSERFIQTVIRSLPLAIYIFDLVQQRNRYLSPQVAHLFGYTPQQMQAMGPELIDTFFHPHDRPRLLAHFALIGASQPDREDHPALFVIAYRINHPQRGWVWVESRDRVYERDADGRPTLLLGTAEDITQRRSREQEVVESEKRLRLAIEATELATWEWNLETDQVYWNEQHFLLFGMLPRPNPLSPADFMNHVHPQDQQRIKDLLARAIAERSVYDAEFCAVRDDGSQRWMSGYGRITEEREGQPIRMSGVMFDVDQRRRAEDALKLADQRKDEFLAMLAHELRNPMATIHSGLQILAITGGKDETSTATITRMTRQTDHLVRMVDDLLDVSRISQDKIVLQTERVNLVALVGQAVESLRTQFEQQGKILQVDLPPAAIEMKGDMTRLTQIVTNLLTNGLRYTGEHGQVWLSLRHQSNQALLEVRDNGIGLAGDQLAAIFELFVQVDTSAARSRGGLGLGLTLVRRLVELHGGRVEAQSEGLGKGSTFRVYLPIVETVAKGRTTSRAETAGQTSGLRILVIDDNVEAALTLGMLLKLKGYEVTIRNSGEAGLEAAGQLLPEAILLDIGMPGLDGYATCQLIREQPWGRDILIIALTGYGQGKDRQRAWEVGFNGHLVKPVDLDVLINLLDKDRSNS